MADLTRDKIAGYLEKLEADRAELRAWIDQGSTAATAVRSDAASIRAEAEELSRSGLLQGDARQDLEGDLLVRTEALERAGTALDDKPPFPNRETYLEFSSLRMKNVIWTSRLPRNSTDSERIGWREEIEQSELWPQFDNAELEILAMRREEVPARDEALERARHAVSQARRVVSNVMLESARPQPESWRPPNSTAGRAAAGPFLAFLVVAAIGSAVSLTTTTLWAAVGVLLLATAAAAIAALKEESGFGSGATLAAGASLAVFTAAYLICRQADADSMLTDSGQSIERISEASLTSLTVGLTGGTLGIELAGAARVVAFVQILLTVALVVSVLGYGWRRLTAPGVPSQVQDESHPH